MNKGILTVIILAIVIVILAVVWLWPKSTTAPSQTQGTQTQNTADIVVEVPQPNQIISSPLTVSGTVNGNGWNGFEGQVGGVQLIDGDGNVLAQAPLTATTDWTKLPTHFQVTLNFTDSNRGATQLVFHNENASGDPSRDKTFVIPVQTQNSMNYQSNSSNLGK